ncbi:MAG: glycosyltransferase family 2 protein [Muribaculaceae bacterium]|nr:glycosyltransferase family 2 protein [Muribaculaceae bacterium]
MKVAILLATYNSDKFLREQLDSLYNQTYLNWELYVHDDGSTDRTLAIIQEYKDKYGNITLLGENIKGLGPRDNFLFLLSSVDSDYYFFCDHDDIWLPQKIQVAIEELQKIDLKKPLEIPAVYHSDLKVVDHNLNIIAASMWRYAKIIPRFMHSKKYVLCATFITGCTLAINKAMKELVPKVPDYVYMHDWWIGVTAVMNDVKIFSDDHPLILYRQHGENAAGIDKTTRYRYLKKFTQILKGSPHDLKIKPLIKKFGVKNYWIFKRLLIIKRLFHQF